MEIYGIKKVLAADYTQKYIEIVIRNFDNDKIGSAEDDYIIPQGFFDIGKPVIIVEVHFCTKNEASLKLFMRKFHNFAGSKFDTRIKWITRKTKTLFKLKDKCLHPACKIYHGNCSCGETYIGEAIRNVETRRKEHNLPSEKSKTSKDLKNSNIAHHFSWSVFATLQLKSSQAKFQRPILSRY